MATMDIREKLVEILKQAPFEGKVLDEWWWEEKIKRIAEHLISNGVTVQEWISVTERLPELGERVICTDGYAVFEQYRVELSCVYGMWDRGGLKSPMQEVTHWMPMPQPPKGE